MNYTVDDAIIVYILRDMRRIDPDGKFDSAGRWYPSEQECRQCCRRIYPPSRKHPYTLLKHCRTLTHVAHLYDVDYATARKEYGKPHWTAARKLIQKLSKKEIRDPIPEVSPMEQYAEKILKAALENAALLKERELRAFTEWFSQYRPEVNNIDWDAQYVMHTLQTQLATEVAECVHRV